MEKLYYIVEMNMNEKQLNEMDALELDNIEQGLNWIKDSMESDAEYFNIDINYSIETIKYEQYGSDLDFYYKALVSVEYNDIVNQEMVNSDIYSVEDIIESNLSIISEIKERMVKR